MRRWVIAAALILRAGVAGAQVADHASVELYDQLMPEQFAAAASLKVMFTDQSVGFNQWDYLTSCLSVAPAVSPSKCRRQQSEPQFQVPVSEFVWTAHAATNWQYYVMPSNEPPPLGAVMLPVSTPCADGGYWYGALCNFIRWADEHADQEGWQVAVWQPSYLHTMQPGIESPTNGLFARNQPTRMDIADFEAMQARHPNVRFSIHTASLARGIGNATSDMFNTQLRAYATSVGMPLLDVADIESHDPSGQPCFDNRDGVPYYQGGTLRENYPDDGMAYAAICQHYTSEKDGGHLGSPSDGGIRLAKAWWVWVAQLTQ